MAKLILSMDGLVLKEIPLSKERTTIGRKPHNDIQIDNLAVSGEHAVIVTILNDSFMEDLGSTNGTLVNGNPVKKHFLQNGDTIELGTAPDGTPGWRLDVMHTPGHARDHLCFIDSRYHAAIVGDPPHVVTVGVEVFRNPVSHQILACNRIHFPTGSARFERHRPSH